MKYSALCTFSVCISFLGCGSDDETDATATETNFLVSTSVSTADTNSTFVAAYEELPTGDAPLDLAVEFPTGIDLYTYNSGVYGLDFNAATITRYSVVDGRLSSEAEINLSNLGSTNYLYFVDDARAYTLNRTNDQLVEFNPQSMTLTGNTINYSEFIRDDIGEEVRGGILRRSDNTLFVHMAYTTNRQVWDNSFYLLVFDLDAGTVSQVSNTDCPATAGFGGFVDSDGSTYFLAGSFGGFTLLLPDAKASCVLRVLDGSRELDASYTFRPSQLMSGSELFGLNSTGDGIALTTGINLPRIGEFEDPIAFLGARIHSAFSVDVRDQTVEVINGLPADGVGLGAFPVGSTLYVPRSSGESDGGDIQSSQTVVYSYDPATNAATERFTINGVLGRILPL
ncbi:MAG: hypothetical protein AAFU77_02435 [Myxococcota bacterium]